jgi:hypothetical protein
VTRDNNNGNNNIISSLLAEIFLQELEVKLYPNLIIRHMKYIGKYVDDVFVIYDEVGTTAEEILQDHNNMHPRMKYNMAVKNNERVSFLDLSLYGNYNEVTIGIYRNHIYTDLVIPASSNHSVNHKMAAFKCILDRV